MIAHLFLCMVWMEHLLIPDQRPHSRIERIFFDSSILFFTRTSRINGENAALVRRKKSILFRAAKMQDGSRIRISQWIWSHHFNDLVLWIRGPGMSLGARWKSRYTVPLRSEPGFCVQWITAETVVHCKQKGIKHKHRVPTVKKHQSRLLLFEGT